ncbi:MAG: response regulator [Deltaproteobacteria bacterium]|nr:response regulator [Deltaproteobacteria bacterium]
MPPIKVMIVEDDFMVADINKGLTEKVEGYKVVRIAKNGREALSYLRKKEVDLIILDIYLPDMHGIDIVKEVRKKEYTVDFILITAAHDVKTIEDSIRFGAFDYIVKPFDAGRYLDSLVNYKHLKRSIVENKVLNQDKVDSLYLINNKKKDALPKGIAEYTLDKVRKAIASCDGPFTIDEIRIELALSRITIRRYLEFIAETGSLKKSFQYKKKGRPTIFFIKKGSS